MNSESDSPRESPKHVSAGDNTALAAASAAANAQSADELATTIREHLCLFDGRPLPVKSHRDAVRELVKLRRLIVDDTRNWTCSRELKLSLLYSGISMNRRLAVDDELDADATNDVKTTRTLLFTLIVECDDAIDAEGSSRLEIDEFSKHSLHSQLESSEAGSPPSALCRAVLFEAKTQEINLARADELAALFFRASAAALSVDLLMSAAPPSTDAPGSSTDFLTLSSVDFAQMASDPDQHAQLQAIADAAESELGQTLLRDLLLSFLLPASVVGVRRTPVMSRAASTEASAEHSEIVGRCHDVAMRGTSWTFENDGDELHKMGSLLAGACVILTTAAYEASAAERARKAETSAAARKKQKMIQSSADAIRFCDAFGGRVSLPFLETAPPPASQSRMALISHTKEWIVFRVRGAGRVRVELRQRGYEGFCKAILQLCK